jgi:hypothetical protein
MGEWLGTRCDRKTTRVKLKKLNKFYLQTQDWIHVWIMISQIRRSISWEEIAKSWKESEAALIKLSSKSSWLLVRSWLLCLQNVPCLVSLWCTSGSSMEFWTKYILFRFMEGQTHYYTNPLLFSYLRFVSSINFLGPIFCSKPIWSLNLEFLWCGTLLWTTLSNLEATKRRIF